MNERIKELAEQVGAVSNFNAMGRNDGVLFTETELEKFAELIVKECIDIVAAGGEFASRPKLVEKLQEHFGIQE